MPKSEFGEVLHAGIYGGDIIRLTERTSKQPAGLVVFVSSAYNPLRADQLRDLTALMETCQAVYGSMKGKLALCSKGTLGLITEDKPREVTYVASGDKGFAYVGVHLTDAISAVGSLWSSRTPKIVGDIVNGIDPQSSPEAHAAYQKWSGK